jgi:hypothetical protein
LPHCPGLTGGFLVDISLLYDFKLLFREFHFYILPLALIFPEIAGIGFFYRVHSRLDIP